MNFGFEDDTISWPPSAEGVRKIDLFGGVDISDLFDCMYDDGPFMPGKKFKRAPDAVDFTVTPALMMGGDLTHADYEQTWNDISNRVAAADLISGAVPCIAGVPGDFDAGGLATRLGYFRVSAGSGSDAVFDIDAISARGVAVAREHDGAPEAHCSDKPVDAGSGVSPGVGAIPARCVAVAREHAGAPEAHCSDGPYISLIPGREFDSNLGYVEITTRAAADHAVAMIGATTKRTSAIAYTVEYGEDGAPALLVLCAGDACFLFRLVLMGGVSDCLASLLENGPVLKIGYGCGADLRCLPRDWGVAVSPVLDLSLVAPVVDHSPLFGLKPLVNSLFNRNLRGTPAGCNWDDVAYSDDMVAYAVTRCVAVRASYEKMLSLVVPGHPRYDYDIWPEKFDDLVVEDTFQFARRHPPVGDCQSVGTGDADIAFAAAIASELRSEVAHGGPSVLARDAMAGVVSTLGANLAEREDASPVIGPPPPPRIDAPDLCCEAVIASAVDDLGSFVDARGATSIWSSHAPKSKAAKRKEHNIRKAAARKKKRDAQVVDNSLRAEMRKFRSELDAVWNRIKRIEKDIGKL